MSIIPQTGGRRLGSWGPAEWVARGSGGPRSLDGWLGSWVPAEFGRSGAGGPQFGWLARSSGAGGVPAELDGWHAVWELGARVHAAQEWLARGFGAGGPRSLDGWPAALGLGTRLWS